jgi:hypothetical protein
MRLSYGYLARFNVPRHDADNRNEVIQWPTVTTLEDATNDADNRNEVIQWL